VHGRNKEEKGQNISSVDWSMVARIRQSIGIPMIANGGIATPEDIDTCLSATGN